MNSLRQIYIYIYSLLTISVVCFSASVLYRPHKTLSLSGCRGALVAHVDKVIALGRITDALSTWVHGDKFGFDVFTHADRVHRCRGSLKTCARLQDKECYCTQFQDGTAHVVFNKTAETYMSDSVVVLWWGTDVMYSSNAVHIKENVVDRCPTTIKH